MSKTEIVRARIDPEVKNKAEQILHDIGLSHSQAIGMFFKQIIFHQGLPFAVKIQNKGDK